MQNFIKTSEFDKHIMPALKSDDMFKNIMQLNGKVFRSVKGRKTLQIEMDGRRYFIKQHFGVGWAEIFKNLFTLKSPIIGAKTEKCAIEKLNQIGIPTTPLVAFGERGLNPATRQSFLITEDLGNIISLEDFCSNWLEHQPSAALKESLIIAVATLAKKLHRAGLVHRDFYLCHLCLDRDLLEKGLFKLYLIDLHRMTIKKFRTGNSVMKDIAALYFSAMDLGLTNNDIALFKQHYGKNFPEVFWHNVKKRANKLYQKYHSEKFQKRLNNERIRAD